MGMNIDASFQPRVDYLSNPLNSSITKNSKTSNGASKNGLLTHDEAAYLEKWVDNKLEELSNKPNLTKGILGDGEFDIYYTPKGVIENSLSAPIVGEKAPTSWQIQYENTPNCWKEFYNILNEYGINHNDSQSMQEFFTNKTLFDEINSAYEERISKLL